MISISLKPKISNLDQHFITASLAQNIPNNVCKDEGLVDAYATSLGVKVFNLKEEPESKIASSGKVLIDSISTPTDSIFSPISVEVRLRGDGEKY